MKKTLTLILTVCALIASTTQMFSQGTRAINLNDTVFFDLANAVTAGSYLEIPVFVKSDDVINSVDFAMKFDLVKLEYDSLIVSRPSMTPLASYNASDKFLRMTSYDLQPITKDTILVAIRFKKLAAGEIKKADFDSVTALLNGDPCTAFIIEDKISAVDEISNNLISDFLIYPNPANNLLNIEVTQNSFISIVDVNGKQMAEITLGAGGKKTLDVAHLPSGNYLVKHFSNNLSSTKQLVITH